MPRPKLYGTRISIGVRCDHPTPDHWSPPIDTGSRIGTRYHVFGIRAPLRWT